jgi:hypothetical protein
MSTRKFEYDDLVRFIYRGDSHPGTVMGQLGKEYVYVLVPSLRLVVTVHPARINSDNTFIDWEERLPLDLVIQEPSPRNIWDADDHLADKKKEIIIKIKTLALIGAIQSGLGR